MLIPKKDLDAILSAEEQLYLQQFADNEKMKSAVKKILLYGLYYGGTLKPGEKADPLKNFALVTVSNKVATGQKVDDAEIGADLRAVWAGINELEGAFSKIDMYRTAEEPKSGGKNPAR